MVLWPSWLLTEKWYVSRPFFLFWTFSVLERADGGWQTWLLIAWDLSAMSTQTKLEKKQEEKNWQGGRDNNTICTLCSVVLMLCHSYSISEGHCCICLGSENKSEILLLFFLDRSALAGDFFLQLLRYHITPVWLCYMMQANTWRGTIIWPSRNSAEIAFCFKVTQVDHCPNRVSEIDFTSCRTE